jgi:hypothetical protein
MSNYRFAYETQDEEFEQANPTWMKPDEKKLEEAKAGKATLEQSEAGASGEDVADQESRGALERFTRLVTTTYELWRRTQPIAEDITADYVFVNERQSDKLAEAQKVTRGVWGMSTKSAEFSR